METEASHIYAEITSAITEISQFLKDSPNNSLRLRYLFPLLPVIRITRRAIANFGKELPQKDIEWCQKWQTIESPEESKSPEDYSAADAMSRDESLTTDLQDNSSAADATTRDDPSTADATTQDESSTTDATSQDESSTTDATTQDNSSITDAAVQNNTSITQDSFIRAKHQRRNARSLIDNEVINKFKGKDSEFELYTQQPNEFWKPPEDRPEANLDERSFFENAAEQQTKLENLNFIRRLDSVIAYLRYKRKMPLAEMIRLHDVKAFLGKIGIPAEQALKQQAVLQGGRRRLQFCHSLSKNKMDVSEACYNDISFDDLDYGPLFLDIDDKIWDSITTKNYSLMVQTIEELKLWDIIAISEQFKAKRAAKALLQHRQASIENCTPPLSNDKENNSTTAPSGIEGNSSIVEHLRTEDNLDSTRASKHSRTEDRPDSITASKRLRTEVISDSTTASEHCIEEDGTTASEHARTEENPDGTTASKRLRTEENSDGVRASEHARTEDSLEMLLQAAAITGQIADASDTSITNLSSGSPTEQLSSETIDSMEELFPEFRLEFSDGQPGIFDCMDVDAIYEDLCNNAQLSDVLNVPLPDIE